MLSRKWHRSQSGAKHLKHKTILWFAPLSICEAFSYLFTFSVKSNKNSIIEDWYFGKTFLENYWTETFTYYKLIFTFPHLHRRLCRGCQSRDKHVFSPENHNNKTHAFSSIYSNIFVCISLTHSLTGTPPGKFPIKVKVDNKANHVVNQLIRGEGHPKGCLESRLII